MAGQEWKDRSGQILNRDKPCCSVTFTTQDFKLYESVLQKSIGRCARKGGCHVFVVITVPKFFKSGSPKVTHDITQKWFSDVNQSICLYSNI